MEKALSEFKLQTGYLKYREDLGRKEVWSEAISERIIPMHKTKYSDLYRGIGIKNKRFRELLSFAEKDYTNKLVLGSQRGLQFGGDPILKHNSKLYNCLTSYVDRVQFFKQAMWWLLSGCGVGFSVQNHHIDKLPTLKKRLNGTKTFTPEDSIEGWSDCVGVLMASYFQEGDDKFKEYYGYDIKFDLSPIRKKGSPISSGFIAPGYEPLETCLIKIENLINNYIGDTSNKEIKIKSIIAYDVIMFFADAVLSGGVRRSATICMFSMGDEDMLRAKTGDWYTNNPQRARSNNSVALLKSSTTLEEYKYIMSFVKKFGEPGVIWVDSLDIIFNPCVEVGMTPYLIRDKGIKLSGWQGCNLTTGNGAMCKDEGTFLRMCKSLSILGTLQAGYTTFDYIEDDGVTEEIFRREALLGCAISGWLDNPNILLNKEILAKGVKIIKETNDELAEIIGINPAARLTCSKPDGNSSVILAASSGIKPTESKRYIRYVQMNPDEYGVDFFKENNKDMFEKSVWDSRGEDYAIGFAIEAKPNALLKKDIYGVRHLEIVKFLMENWVYPGTVVERCVNPLTKHNISNTIAVDNWEDVINYIYTNREFFAGVSFLEMDGSLEYNQSPFSEVLNIEELIEKYGEGVMLASGLIVDGLHAFGEDLWTACNYTLNRELKLEGSRQSVFLKSDWIRRSKKFAKNYFNNDLKLMTYCLKDVHRYYRYMTIRNSYKEVDWSNYLTETISTEVDTLGAISCSGGQCEII